MDNHIRSGGDVEDLVEVICNKMFFSDFVVRNPKYIKSSGSEKEAADLLVPFKDYLLVFQVKTKIDLTPPNEKVDLDFQRISDTAEKAIKQLKTIRRALDNDWLGVIQTVRGFEIPFNTSDYEHVIGIVIIDIIGEEKFPRKERTEFLRDYISKYGMPIHVMMRDDFELLATEIDTLPDFVKFLSTREEMIRRGLLKPPISLIDFLAFYKTRPDLIEKSLNEGICLHLGDAMWEEYQEKFSSDIQQRNQLNRPSYIIDEIIDFLYSSSGYNAFDHVAEELGSPKLDDVMGYLTSAREIASLDRLQRRVLGKRFLDCMRKAESKDFSYSLMVDQKLSHAYLVLSMGGDRENRQYRLHHLCCMAYCLRDLNQIIGIATEPLSVTHRSFDVYGLNGAEFENKDELIEQAKKYFGKPYQPIETEYQGNMDDT